MRLLIAAVVLTAGSVSAFAADKGTTVDLGGIKSTTPGEWKEEQPSSNMRMAQFKLPKADGDTDEAELAIFVFPGGSGTVEQNLKRQEAKFDIPAGKKPDVSTFKLAGNDATLQDIQGTFLKKFPPFAPDAKITRMENYRQLYVVFENGQKQYYMTLLGPTKTVEKHKKSFEEWVKNFK